MAPASATLPGVKLRLIQPNVGQDDASFSPQNKQAILRRYFDLSERATSPDRSGIRDVTHLIWPESAFPFILSRDPQALSEIVDFLGPGATLITGAARRDDGSPAPLLQFDRDRRPGRVVGAALRQAASGAVRRIYAVREPVGAGAYHPVRRHSRRIRSRARAAAFSMFPGLPDAMPLICYEAIFPTELGDALSGAERPGWLLNVTDDAWFGLTPGPYQHFAQARLRAIELGLAAGARRQFRNFGGP